MADPTRQKRTAAERCAAALRRWLGSILHNSVAHPLMPFLPTTWGDSLHDWTLRHWPPDGQLDGLLYDVQADVDTVLRAAIQAAAEAAGVVLPEGYDPAAVLRDGVRAQVRS